MEIEFGSIGKVNLNPTKGTEIHSYRPVLVISNSIHSKMTGQIIVLPITNTNKNYPLDVELSRFDGHGNKKKTTGVILTEQPRAIDYKQRDFRFVEFASDEDLEKVKDIFRDIFEDLFNV